MSTHRKQRRPLYQCSTMTMGRMIREPDRAVGPSDIAAAGVGPRSYRGIRDWIASGKLPAPIKLPNGRVIWLARDVLQAVGIEPGVQEINA